MRPAVTPVVVTRGDVDLSPILATLAADMAMDFDSGPPVVWNNATAALDLRPFGGLEAAAVITTPLIYFQDDDVLVARWRDLVRLWTPGRIICNMAPDFQAAYRGKRDKLIGHGGVFETALVRRTFDRYFRHYPLDAISVREPNRIFTGLNEDRLQLEYVGHVNLPYASAPDRLWKQPNHGRAHIDALARVDFVLSREAAGR